MSFIYSRALVEEYLPDKCSGIDAFVQLKESLTHNQSLLPDKMTVHSLHSQYGMTFAHLTDGNGGGLLTLLLAGFRAKTYQQPEEAQESTENGQDCGGKWRGWLAKYDPVTSLWKTAQCSFIEDLGESLATFPRSGMTRNGLLWELPMLERRTREKESGFWPTPTATDYKGSPTVETTLSRAQKSSRGVRLPEELTRRGVYGLLNPQWVEWLMGWPIGHTDLKPLETDKSRSAL